MEKKWKYAAVFVSAGTATGIYYPDKVFLGLMSIWLFVIPAVVAIYLAYGLVRYLEDRKKSTMVKNNDTATKVVSIVRQEEPKKEKDVLYTQVKNVKKEGQTRDI